MADKPNLVYLLADQLRFQSCGYAGDAKARTSHIDALAAESMSFVNAVSGHPVCAPYRASLLTGKYSSSTGMVINELRLGADHRCLGHVLTDAGYETAYVGKWHLWANQLGHHHNPRNSYTPPGPYRLGFDGFWAAYNFHHHYVDAYYHRDSPERIILPGYEPDGQTDLAIKVLREAAGSDRPLALFVSYGTPHDPWRQENVPTEYYDLFCSESFDLPPNYRPENDPHADSWARFSAEQRGQLSEWMRVYYAMVANLDWNVGRLLAFLEETGMRENTILVFTSDHGEMFGAQGRRAKNVFYEEAVRVPFLIRWPGHVPPGTTSDACLNTPDIMPTLLSAMGLPVPAAVEGVDLSHCALGREGPEPEAAFLQGMGTTAAWVDGHEWRALRDKQYTYALYRADRQELLFSHQDDPFQMCNLAQESACHRLLEGYRAMLGDRMAALNDTFEACTWYRDHWTEDRVILRTATL